jgi:hypothetical protein
VHTLHDGGKIAQNGRIEPPKNRPAGQELP